jgi:spermidine synthase
MLDDSEWFTEVVDIAGSAFSLRIRRKLHEEQTPYQTITVYETTHFGNLMVIDGFTMLSARENFLYHEMLAHPVLFTHPAPRRVCIIGGGDCGTLREVLKHPDVESVTQIDIDERVTRVAEEYFPELTESNADPRATLLFDDGIRWITDAKPQGLDVIIIDSTDPVGPAEGLFSEEFYRNCLSALDDGGLLVQQSESPLYHMDIIAGMYADLKGAGFSQLRTLFFPQAIYPSGWWSATMARKGPLKAAQQGTAKAAREDAFRRADVQARGFETRYYNADVHTAALAQPEFFRARLGDFGD